MGRSEEWMDGDEMPPTAANRPVRKRKSVTHYSDDNPSTFTVKRKRGQIEVDDTVDETTTQQQPAKSSPSSGRGGRRGRGRPPKKQQQVQEPREEPVPPPKSVRRRSSSSRSSPPSVPTAAVVPAAASAQAQPKRRGRPPSRRPPRKRKLTVIKPKETRGQGEILPHSVTVRPILPIHVLDGDGYCQEEEEGRRRPSASHTGSTSSSHEQNMGSLFHWSAPTGAPPAARDLCLRTRLSTETHEQLTNDPPITCMAARFEEDDAQKKCSLIAMGDASGCVTLYRILPTVQSLQRIQTLASEREVTRIINSRTVIQYPNAVVSTAWKNDCVVVLTCKEMECLADDNEQRWILPVSTESASPTSASANSISAGQVQLEWKKSYGSREASLCSLLWTTGSGPSPVLEDGIDASSSGLFLVQFDTAASPCKVSCREVHPYPDCICLTAIWDNSGGVHAETIVCVVYRRNVDAETAAAVELVRYDLSTSKIVSSEELTYLPIGRGGVTQWECFLQKRKGLVFLSSARGIRVFSADDLSCLEVYGETVTLHGKAVHWQSCLWVKSPNYSSGDICHSKKQAWLYREDELKRRDDDDSLGDKREDEYMLIGIPHPFRGPLELQSTLYVWKPGQAVPLTTLQAPKGGLLSCHFSTDACGMWRMICLAGENGRAFDFKSSFQSNFAGVQYPVGYQVVEDNLEYIEDEDELDEVVLAVDEGTEDSDETTAAEEETTDPDLAEAMRRSLLDTQEVVDEEREDVSVMPAKGEVVSGADFPCRLDGPTRVDGDISPSTPKMETPAKHRDDLEFLAGLPQWKIIRNDYKQHRQHVKAAQEEAKAATAADQSNAAPSRPRGKRSRTANIEAILQSAIVPELRSQMITRGSHWAAGNGSRLPPHATLPQVEAEVPLERKSFDGKMPAVHSDRDTKDDESTSYTSKTSGNAEKVKASGGDSAKLASSTEIRPGADVDFSLSSPPSSRTGKALSVDVERTTPTSQDSLKHDSADGRSDRSLERFVVHPDGMERRSPSISSRISAEEKELALELLLLSPSSEKKASLNRTNEKPDTERHAARQPAPSVAEEEAVVTPSEQSPAHTTMTQEVKREATVASGKGAAACAACQGRMVMHLCGKREKPIDYEAIERAERERVEREAAEKQRRRMEKRRAAEARRREARRQKKLEEERKRREEEERMKRLEAESFERAHIREHENEPVIGEQRVPNGLSWRPEAFQPAFSPLKSNGAISQVAAVGSLAAGESVNTSESESLTERKDFQGQSSNSKSWTGSPYKEGDPQGQGTSLDDTANGSQNEAKQPPAALQPNQGTAELQSPLSRALGHDMAGRVYKADQPLSTLSPLSPPSVAAVPAERLSGEGDDQGGRSSAPGGDDAVAESSQQAERSSAHSPNNDKTSTQSNLYADKPKASPLSKIDVTELPPSTTLSTSDALEALAGLANSMPAVSTASRPSHNFTSGSYNGGSFWKSTTWNASQYGTTEQTDQRPTTSADPTAAQGQTSPKAANGST